MSLERLLRPKSIAVIGGGAWCEAVIERCRDQGFAGPIWPVHARRESVVGLSAFRHVDDLPATPDAAFVGVNRKATIDVVQALSDQGAGGAVCFASGFKEAEDGVSLQQRLARAAGAMPFLGPNCYGFINNVDSAALWPDVHGLKPVCSGVAIIGQSSNVLLNLTMQRRGLPVAYLIAAGNQATVSMAEISMELLDDARVTALGLHVEGFGDIRGYEMLAAKARRMGKAIVVLKSGRSAAAQQATLSHTASLAGSDAGAKALMARLGMLRADSLTQFLSILAIVHLHGRLCFEHIASLSCSGGEASLMADAADGLTLAFPPLTAHQRQRLREYLGTGVTLANPLDYHTDIWRNPDALKAVYATMAEPPTDIACLVLDYPRIDRCDHAEWIIVFDALIAAKAQSAGAFALVASLPENMPEDVAERAFEAGIVPLIGIDDALSSLAATQTEDGLDEQPVLLGKAGGRPVTLVEADAKEALQAFGLKVPVSATATTADEAADYADKIGFPIVLKGEGAAHKSEAGLVQIGLCSREDVLDAANAMPTERFLVERMITGSVVELLVGVVHDPAHGFVLTLGAGGTLTELLDDRVSLLVPSSRDVIEQALSRLKTTRLLQGYRGRSTGDLRLVLDAIEAIQAYVIANADGVTEVEVNPLLITPDDAVAVDALIVRTS